MTIESVTHTTSFRAGETSALPAVIRSLGHSPEDTFAKARVDAEVYTHPERRIAVQDLGRLLDFAARITERPDIALLLADDYRPERLGLIGDVMAAGPDLNAALKNLVRLFQYNSLAGYVVLSVSAGEVLIKFELRDSDFPGSEYILEGATGIIARLIRSLCGEQWRPDEVHLGRKRTSDRELYEKFFGAPIRFSATEDALFFPSKYLALPVKREEHRREAQLLEIAAAPYSEKVRRQVAMRLGLLPINAEAVACRLGTSRRQLFRRLKVEDTSFQKIVDEFRFARARHLLATGDAPLAQIAFALGFPEHSAFTRAFVRWSGVTPTVWRRDRRD